MKVYLYSYSESIYRRDTYDVVREEETHVLCLAPVRKDGQFDELDVALREWKLRQRELAQQEISGTQYLEWKINWPYICSPHS